MAQLAHPRIVNWNAVSTLGRTAAQTGFFLRAGQSQIRLTPFVDEWGERVRMSFVPSMELALTGIERMLSLANDALIPLLNHNTEGDIRVAVAVPERFAAKPLRQELNDEGQLLANRLTELAMSFGRIHIELFPSGRAGGALALQRAGDWLQNPQTQFAIAGGVDSYYDWAALEQVYKLDRGLTEDNIDGFLPGEGAAFVALSKSPASKPIARFIGLATGIEEFSILSRNASRSSGITNALNAATVTVRGEAKQIKYWLVDLTHESYGIKEFQTVIARFGDLMGAGASIQTPLREIGNIGAATLPLFVTLACEAWSRGYAPDTVCLAMAGSDNGLRSAAVLEKIAA